MEDKIEVGDYIRTIDGYIRKVIQINKKGTYEALCHGTYSVDKSYKGSLGISAKKVKKSSKETIDLIENGDILFFKDGSIAKIQEINNDYYLLKDYNGEQYYQNKEIVTMDIESILTKEQYESNCYKIDNV